MSEKTYSELEDLAKKLKKFFKKQDYDLNKIYFIEVRYTKEYESNAESFVSYK